MKVTVGPCHLYDDIAVKQKPFRWCEICTPFRKIRRENSDKSGINIMAKKEQQLLEIDVIHQLFPFNFDLINAVVKVSLSGHLIKKRLYGSTNLLCYYFKLGTLWNNQTTREINCKLELKEHCCYINLLRCNLPRIDNNAFSTNR